MTSLSSKVRTATEPKLRKPNRSLETSESERVSGSTTEKKQLTLRNKQQQKLRNSVPRVLNTRILRGVEKVRQNK